MNKYKDIEQNRKTIIINNFLGGVAWGIGVTVGASILIAIFGIILRQINFIPVIGDIIVKIIEFVDTNKR